MPSLLACFGVGVMGHPCPTTPWPAVLAGQPLCSLRPRCGPRGNRFLARFASRRKSLMLCQPSLSPTGGRGRASVAVAVGAPEAAPRGGRAQGRIRQGWRIQRPLGRSPSGATPSTSSSRAPPPKRRRGRGVCFLWVPFLCTSKERELAHQGRNPACLNHPKTHGADRDARPKSPERKRRSSSRTRYSRDVLRRPSESPAKIKNAPEGAFLDLEPGRLQCRK